MTGQQLDAYERRWSNVLKLSGATLIMSGAGAYFLDMRSTPMLACCGGVGLSLLVGAIAVAKLRELERGFSGSDREARSDTHSALNGLDD